VLVGYGGHLAAGECGEERLGLLYLFEGDAEESTGRDGVDLSSAALAVATPDETVRVVDEAALDAEDLQGAREQAKIAEVLR
jgi:hypothetical protein